jgi:hypothetical protein
MDLMTRPEPDATAWPALDYPAWRDTAATLQLWTQVVGKIRLAFTPWLNHSWHVPLYVNARGLGTSLIHADAKILDSPHIRRVGSRLCSCANVGSCLLSAPDV